MRKKAPIRWGRGLFIALVVLLALGACALVAARFVGLELRPPHTVIGLAEPLSGATRAELDAALADDRPLDRDEAIKLALAFTARNLAFSVDRLNGAEYSDLFAPSFDAAAKVAGSTARAYRVRSVVRVFGKVVPLRGFADHEWVLIADKADGMRIFVDPAFHDAWLGAGIERNVVEGRAIVIPF